MKPIERVSKFEPQLLNAFDKMIRGINIELTKEYREKTIKDLKRNDISEELDRWWFIMCINKDETLNLCSNRHSTLGNVKISDCIL